MTKQSRDKILKNLNRSQVLHFPFPAEPDNLEKKLSKQDRISLLKQNLEKVRAEVRLSNRTEWVRELVDIVESKNISKLLYSPDVGLDGRISGLWHDAVKIDRLKTRLYSPAVEIGADIRKTWQADNITDTELVEYGEEIEIFKPNLFEIDAAITSTKGAIAENGALILWPDEKEPRLMSLVPPIHIALVEASTVKTSFAEAIECGKWSEGMPSNVVLVSGPSKTADIELVLAFGVHGPKELIVIIVD